MEYMISLLILFWVFIGWMFSLLQFTFPHLDIDIMWWVWFDESSSVSISIEIIMIFSKIFSIFVSITWTWNVYLHSSRERGTFIYSLQSTMASLTSTQLVIDWPECTNQLTIFFNEHNDAVSERFPGEIKDTKDINVVRRTNKAVTRLVYSSSCKYQQGSLLIAHCFFFFFFFSFFFVSLSPLSVHQ